MLSGTVQSIQHTLSMVFDGIHERDYIPWFWQYHGHLAQKSSVLRLIRELNDNFELADFHPEGKVILDAGCGFGITALAMRLMGAKELHAIDLYKPMIDTFCKMLSFLPSVGSVFPLIGDVANTSYLGNTFDLAFSNEAISHYYDIDGFLNEMWRVLKPGGILLISDANNGANPWRVWQTKRIWTRFENGPTGPIGHHLVETPYRALRARIVCETNSSLSQHEVESLAVGTFGYTREQVQEACQTYKEKGILPKSYYRYGIPPLDPNSKTYIERLIYPYQLSRRLKRVGYKFRIYAHVGGAGGNSVVRTVNKVVENASPITWGAGRCLKIVARK